MKMVVNQEVVPPFGYGSAKEMEQDNGLQALFKDGLVTKCEVYTSNGRRLIGLPFMEWDRLVSEIDSKFGESRAG